MTKASFHNWQLEKRLFELSHIQRLAFAASCCERAFPNYVVFAQLARWGNPAVFRTSLNAAWDVIEGSRAVLVEHPTLEQQCESLTPDLDDFSTPDIDVQAAAGQEAAFMIRLLLQFCEDSEPSYALRIATFSRDTIDMYVQVLENLDPVDPQLNEKIAQHPLMLDELQRQEADLRRLATLMASDEMKSFRILVANPEKSNIGLCP